MKATVAVELPGFLPDRHGCSTLHRQDVRNGTAPHRFSRNIPRRSINLPNTLWPLACLVKIAAGRNVAGKHHEIAVGSFERILDLTRLADLLAKRTCGNGCLQEVSAARCMPASGVETPLASTAVRETSWRTHPELANLAEVATARVPTRMQENISTKVRQSWQRYRFF